MTLTDIVIPFDKWEKIVKLAHAVDDHVHQAGIHLTGAPDANLAIAVKLAEDQISKLVAALAEFD